MKYIILLLVLSLVLAGCGSYGPVRTYTFKKERVDQSLEGNRGYVEGTPPPASEALETRKRTIIGIDVELPPYKEEERGSVVKERPLTKEGLVKEKPVMQLLPPKEEYIKGEKVEDEEEWIK